jgi:hypothetical protein
MYQPEPGGLPRMTRMRAAGIGFRVHSGWAVAIAVTGPLRSPVLALRRTIELADPAVPASRQPYHAGENIPLDQAEGFVNSCILRAREMATTAVRQLLSDLPGRENQAVACGCAVLSGSDRPPGTVAEVLASHMWMHAAEGQLFRNALAHGGAQCGLRVSALRERDIDTLAVAKLGLSQSDLESTLAQFGRTAGPPWRRDQKLAALAAWVSLSEDWV